MRNIQFNISLMFCLYDFSMQKSTIEETSNILFMKVSDGLRRSITSQIKRSTYEPNRQLIFNTNKI